MSFNAPPPTVSQIKSPQYVVAYKAPAHQGATVSEFGTLIQQPSIDDLGRPPTQYYPIQTPSPSMLSTPDYLQSITAFFPD